MKDQWINVSRCESKLFGHNQMATKSGGPTDSLGCQNCQPHGLKLPATSTIAPKRTTSSLAVLELVHRYIGLQEAIMQNNRPSTKCSMPALQGRKLASCKFSLHSIVFALLIWDSLWQMADHHIAQPALSMIFTVCRQVTEHQFKILNAETSNFKTSSWRLD